MQGKKGFGPLALIVAGLAVWSGCDDDNLNDTIPPAPIQDLTLTPVSETSARFLWTAPGDDGAEGRATRYRIALATNDRTLDIINFCSSGILGLVTNPVPKPGGEAETLLVQQLIPGQTYQVRIVAEDAALNRSESTRASMTLPDTTPPSARWEYLGDAFDGVVLRLIPDGAGLVAVGLFTKIGAVSVPGVARWSGATWEPMSAGLPDTTGPEIGSLTLRAAALVQGRPTICGSLTRRVGTSDKTFPYVAQWNGTAWDSLRTGRTGDAFDVIEYGGRIVLAGNFLNIGGAIGAHGVASWNGADWTTVGPDSTFKNASISSLAVDGGTLLVAGSFDTTDVVRSKRLASFNGASWRAFGISDPPGSVFALAFLNGQAIVAGGFGIRQVAPGGAPDSLGAGLRRANCSTATANTLFADSSRLLVGGDFNLAGDVRSLSLAAWTGTRWSALGRQDNVGVSAVTRLGGRIAVSGGFDDGTGAGVKIRVAAIAQ